jgi:Tol biopolymer transport system component
MRKLAILILVGASTAAVTVLLAGCGSAPGASHCTANSDCAGDAVCEQNVCQQGYRLTASAGGDGKGRVTSSPDGIDCPGNCSAVFPAGASVTLRSIPEASSDFMGWTGGCSGTGDCPLTIDAARSMTAVFRSNHVVFGSGLALDGSNTLGTAFNVWRVNADGSGRTALTKATATGANSMSAVSSPDGRLIAFLSSRSLDGSDAANVGTTWNVWRMNADGTAQTPLTKATASKDGIISMSVPQWSPDGKQIVFSSVRSLDGSDAPSAAAIQNVWRVNADGTGLAPLTRSTAAPSTSPQWSPDGSRIVFSSSLKLDGTDAKGPDINIWRMNADGTALTPLTRTTVVPAANSNANSNSPMWSPDGTRIVFFSARNIDLSDSPNLNSTTNIWTINADGTNLKALTKATALNASSMSPRWSPDGRQIVFSSALNIDGSNSANLNSTSNLWRMDADGTNLLPLTHATGGTKQVGTALPFWSPTGSRVIFGFSLKLDGTDAQNDNDTLNVWRFDVKSGAVSPLTKGTANTAHSMACSTGGGAELWLLELGLATAWMSRRRTRRR